MQSIYEGNVRFEHCYRLDLEVDTAPTHRAACWKEWLGMYTFGQPRDRIEYARKRVHAFANGDTSRPRLELMKEQQTEARPFYLVVPAPSSGHAPPQATATPYVTDAGSAAPIASTPSAPEDECAAACRVALTDCSASCERDAVAPLPKCKACASDYKGCMKRCFK